MLVPRLAYATALTDIAEDKVEALAAATAREDDMIDKANAHYTLAMADSNLANPLPLLETPDAVFYAAPLHSSILGQSNLVSDLIGDYSMQEGVTIGSVAEPAFAGLSDSLIAMSVHPGWIGGTIRAVVHGGRGHRKRNVVLQRCSCIVDRHRATGARWCERSYRWDHILCERA